MTDLPAFYTRHHARLRKWLPEGFLHNEHGWWWMDEKMRWKSLPESFASIFLEHAARRVVDAEWLRVDGIARFYLGWTLEDFALELDALFPEDSQ